jgi:hypothetical protein
MDALFPAANWLGVPDLDPDLQPDCVPLPVRAWGSVARTAPHRGTWHCYVDDARFAALVAHPDRLVPTGAPAACEPNVSCFDDTPLALALAGVYRKRWVARYWQACGVRVFVDLNVPARLAERPEAWFGVPPGWRAFSTRGYDRRADDLDREYALARAFDPRPLLLVVGGGRRVADWCEARPGVVHAGYQGDREVYRGQG